MKPQYCVCARVCDLLHCVCVCVCESNLLHCVCVCVSNLLHPLPLSLITGRGLTPLAPSAPPQLLACSLSDPVLALRQGW